jgi:hypothetical protein
MQQKDVDLSHSALWFIALNRVINLKSKLKRAVQRVMLVSIKFTATTPEEAQGIATITKTGLTEPQFETVNNDIYPLTKTLGDEGRNATPVEKQKFDASVQKIVTPK